MRLCYVIFDSFDFTKSFKFEVNMSLTAEFFTKFKNNDHLSQFLHQCINDLSTDNASNSKLGGFINSETPEFDTIRKTIQDFYCRHAVEENHLLPKDLPANVETAIETVFKLRHKDIVNFLIKENLIKAGHTLVENFDWKLKWVLGSSKLSTIREPICQIDLCCVSLGEDLKSFRTSVNFECNLEKLDKLISVLSSVKTELEDI